MITGKHVLILAASVTTGYTVQAAVEAVQYYGGSVAGIAAIFATKDECMGYPIRSVFNTENLEDYASFPSHECPLCRQGKKINALVNSFGYSSIR
jgi:orotate phosphoribosyltransferase